jgi:hypothetical protein
MGARFALLLIIAVASNACSKNKIEQNDKPFFLGQDSATVDSKLVELVQTVLNLPSVVRLSKSEFIQKKYDKVFVFFEENGLETVDSIIYQNGFAIEVTHARKPLDVPCYVFKKINIKEDTAYILLYFDITGFTCYGNLNFIDGKWIPDKDFKIGYR